MAAKPKARLGSGRTKAELEAELKRLAAERDDAQRRLIERTAERDEALEQQTATAEVLQVINASPGDLVPVFHAVLEKGVNLCSAAFGVLQLNDGDRFRTAATYGVPPAFAEYRRHHAFVEGPGSLGARIRAGEGVVHVLDLKDDEPYRAGDANRVSMVDLGGARTGLAVALTAERGLLGFVIIYRQEVQPFTDKQIALLQNFAAQAVIAVENARLITETREALEQQTATSEVLETISSSPGRLEPVFETVLANAVRICGGKFGLLALCDGDGFIGVAAAGLSRELSDNLSRLRHPPPGTGLHRLQETSQTTQVADCAADPAYDAVRAQNPLMVAVRTALHVPMLRERDLLGAILIYRDQVLPFTESEVELVENFAKQAAIAIENARLITETREALDQQTATAEVLGVINSSPGDLVPVFDAMLQKAMRLCEAGFGELDVYDGQYFRVAATLGVPPAFNEYRRNNPSQVRPGSFGGRLMAGEPLIHIVDLTLDELFLAGNGNRRAIVDLGRARTVLVAPLAKEDSVLGFIILYRTEVRPFTERQIALLQNFAAQAVIAMENARLITETREALEQQTATAEVLGVINSSPGDLSPVWDAMLEKAVRLCEAETAHLLRYDGVAFSRTASLGIEPEFDKLLPVNIPLPHAITKDSVPYRLLSTRATIHVHDLRNDESVRAGAPAETAAVEQHGARTVLFVPLLREGEVIGCFVLHRLVVRPFSDKQIALVQNFAAQAVIAMENARLITETREALEQQTATADVLGVINSSPGDLKPVFHAILDKAHSLCGAEFGGLLTYDGQSIRLAAERNLPPAWADLVRGPWLPRDDHPVSRIIRGERLFQIDDMAEIANTSDDPVVRAAVELGGIRSLLLVPLRKEEAFLGYITAYRQEVSPFTDAQIALLQNFASQAVIAMENARLLGELQQRTGDLQESLEYQTATSEVLKVMSGSAFELAPVLQTVVTTAVRLCRADQATIYRLEDSEYRWAADHSLTPDYERIERNVRIRPGTGTLVGRVAVSRDTVQILDAWTDPLYEVKEDARVGGVHTMLGVPLLREGLPIGVIGLARRRIEPYTDKETELVRTFADQAVIAIENARLLGEIRQRQAELRVTFDNMADGVVMFDEELRLAAWNRNFQELLDLSDAVLAQRPSYADYLRILAQRGEFGTENTEADLRLRLERTDQEFRNERTRPDGRVIEVRRNAVPDGGFVLIYSDITERKRSETEIRAARDAAEAAYSDLKAAQANLVQAEKMASLGQLTAGIAHEIKNPLNFVNNFASLSVELLDELKETAAPAIATLDDDERAEVDETMVMLTGNLEKIAEHGKRADNIVKSMLEHSRGVSGERRAVDLNGVIEEALNLAYHGARAQDQSFNITLERDYAESLKPIELAPQEMTRVFLNLFGNGFYAANKRAKNNGDGSFRPVLTVTTRGDDEAIEVRVRDNGIGIPPEIKDKLFQPFFTTKPTGEGTGLGLSISYDIVTQQHGGTITVESEPGAYTEFTVRLPRR